jgi:nicotinamidase-related amidase
VITNNSVEATVRMAGNLDFDTFLVEDATFTFGRRDWVGRVLTADEVHAMSLASSENERNCPQAGDGRGKAYCRMRLANNPLFF